MSRTRESNKSVMARKRVFASLPIIQALATVKCGFELETQAVDGETFDEIRDNSRSFDEDAWTDAISDKVSAFNNHYRGMSSCIALSEGLQPNSMAQVSIDVPRDLRQRGIGTQLVKLFKAFKKTCTSIPETAKDSSEAFYDWLLTPEGTRYQSLESMANACVPAFELDKLGELLTEHWEQELDRDDFTRSNDDEDGELNMDCPEGIHAKHDGSVEGPEFIVKGNGTTAPNFIRLLKSLFKRYDLTIDEGCSFHIHLSVPGIKHSYGPLMQCHMMEYLLQHVDRVPASVRKRWENDTNYFKPIIDTDKYTFVHYHSGCKTWEFRCFGNVKNAKDGMKCLKLAVEALQYAYKVSLGMTKSQFNSESDWDKNIFSNVINDKVSLDKTLKDRRKYTNDNVQVAA